MRVIHSIMNARYRVEGPASAPDYVRVLDLVQAKVFWGRFLPRTPSVERVLDEWTRNTHSGLVPLLRFLRYEHEFLAIFPCLDEDLPLNSIHSAKWNHEDFISVFLRLLSVKHLLFLRQLSITSLDLSLIFYHPQHGVRILGHEAAIRIERRFEEAHESLDIRYASPERLRGEPPTFESEIYSLGALFYHFLTGTRLHSGAGYRPVQELRPKLRHGWDALLQPMLEPHPDARPGMNTLWEKAQAFGLKPKSDWLEHWNSPVDEHILALLIDDLLASNRQARASAIQVIPGRERIARLAPFSRLAEERGFLVLHTWQSEPQPKPYQTMNEIIQLFRLGVRRLCIDGLEEALRPIAEWEDASTITTKWAELIETILKALIPGHFQGIILIVEDLHNVDPASLEGLLNLCGWMKKAPFLLVVTGATFTHSHFRTLEERLDVEWVFHHPASISLERVNGWADRDGLSAQHRQQALRALGEVHNQEVFFLQWVNDRITRDGGFARFLELCWSQLRPREQLLMKLYCLCERPISVEDLEAAIGISGLDPVAAQLHRFKFLRGGFLGRYQVAVPAFKRHCLLQIHRDDAMKLRECLLAFERNCDQPDLVQMLHLAIGLNLEDSIQDWSDQLKARILERWDLGLLWRLEALHQKNPKAGLKPFADLAALISGLAFRTGAMRYDSLFYEWAQALNAERAGDRHEAYNLWKQLASRRHLPRGLKCYLAVRRAFLDATEQIPIEVLRIWRKLAQSSERELEKSALNEWRAQIAISMAQIGHSEETVALVEKLPSHLKAWVDANHAWNRDDFETALQTSQIALSGLNNHYDLCLRAEAFKLRGNALYRANQPVAAVEAYREAHAIILQTEHRKRIADIRHNLASAEFLSGDFHAARDHFHSLESAANDEPLFQTQILWYQMASALLLFDLPKFHYYYKQHHLLTTKLRLTVERQRALAIRLQAALLWSQAEVQEELAELEQLLALNQADSLLVAETEVALRFARFAIGLPSERKTSATELTSWRHELLDLVTGEERPYEMLMEQIGAGYFRALHFLWLFSLVETHQLPHRYFNEALAKAFEQHARSIRVDLGRFLRQHFGHLRGLGEVPPADWDRALCLFERLRWADRKPQQFRTDLLNTLQTCWPHEGWGLAESKRQHWQPAEICSDHETASDVCRQLDMLAISRLTAPLHAQFQADPEKSAMGLILLPIHNRDHETLFWLLTPKVDSHASAQYEPLFRFFAKLLEWVESVEPVEKKRFFQERLAPDTHLGKPASDPILEKNSDLNAFVRFNLIGTSPNFLAACQSLARYADTDLNIWIYGESGTGKELAARAIHGLSARRDKPFRAINCAHYPDNLVEAELFGHVRGSYTGAQSDRAGVLELAEGGTLFLDEIGDINEKVQSLLLRVVQEGEFSRVGETRVRKVDLRLVCATNKNLHQMIDRGSFREDLYFRLVEAQLGMPPLRERLEDLPVLLAHFARKHVPQRRLTFAPEYIQFLSEYSWPGNIRELESYIRRVSAHWPNIPHLTRQEALPFLRQFSVANGLESSEPSSLDRATLETLEWEYRKKVLLERLALHEGNRTQTAKSLGLSRQQLTNLIQKFGIS